MLAGIAAVVAIAFIVEQSRPYRFPPIPTNPLPVPNAYDYYCKASDGATRDERVVKIPNSLLGSVYSKYPPQLQQAILKATQRDVATMRAGFAFPYMCSYDRSNRSRFSYVAHFRELARLRQLQALVDERHGDWGSAAAADVDDLKLGADVPHGGPIIAALVGVACEAIGRRDMWAVVPHLTFAQAQAAKARLLSIDAGRSKYSDAQVEEKYDGQADLQVRFKPRDWASQIARDETSGFDGTAGSPSAFDKFLFVWRMRIAGKKGIYEQYSAYQDAVIDAARIPYADHSPINRVPLDPITGFEQTTTGFDPYDISKKVRVRFVDCQAQDRLLIVSLALRQYFLRNHTYPSALSQLVPAYLAGVPDDPFAVSGPLRYIKFSNTYCLYSIGPDGIDNHGAAIGSVSPGVRPFVVESSKVDIVAGVSP